MINLSHAQSSKAERARRFAAMAQDAVRTWRQTQEPPTSGAAEPSPDQAAGWLRFVPPSVRGLVETHVPPAFRTFDGLGDDAGFPLPGGLAAAAGHAAMPERAQFLAGSFSNPAGTRPYKLYVPSGYKGEKVPLIVMLHGCTQSPDDFAAGTQMNAAAEERTCLVVYPGQTRGAHPQKCWKWFSAEDQQRDAGEPSLIAGITRQVMRDYAVDPARVYIAGMSAGGAAAAIMGQTYPDLYAAVGVHSGLACGSAHDLPSAMAAMRGNGASPRSRPGKAGPIVPTIVFHGDRDKTVSPRNGHDVVEQAAPAAGSYSRVVEGKVPGGHDYTCTIELDDAGRPAVEHWQIRGAGHAWSGGSTAGSYTDPQGPDATREMLRFFQEHPRTS